MITTIALYDFPFSTERIQRGGGPTSSTGGPKPAGMVAIVNHVVL